MNKIKPVLRYPGSKYKKIDFIINALNINKDDDFLDMFGGSGIVGVNVNYLTRANTTINDFDFVLPITEGIALKNMLSFQGLGKNFTKSAFEYFRKRVENGYWNKLQIYNEELKKCKITHLDFKHINLNDFNKIYVDPPYYKIERLYKGNFDITQHLKLQKYLNKRKENGDKNLKILISYNDTPFIRKLYKNWFITTLDYSYRTGKPNANKTKKKTKELIISNFEIGVKNDTKRNIKIN